MTENNDKKPQELTQQRHTEDDIVGKAYDSRLMRRLLTYLRPYRAQAIISLVAIVLKALCDVVGPLITLIAVNRYMAPISARQSQPLTSVVPATHGTIATFVLKLVDGFQSAYQGWLSHLSSNPTVGIAELAGIWLCALCLSYGLEFLQTYLMQWTGQKIMFDMRSQIFRHLQKMHIGFYDRNPVGRLVTRVTSDVDALNEMFTSGVLAIFEDIFVLLGIVIVMLCISWWLALVAFAVLPAILYITRLFRIFVRESFRRIRTAVAKINAYLQEHASGMAVVQLFNREDRCAREFEVVNTLNMEAYKDAIFAYSLYYPAVEWLSTLAIALVIWLGGRGVLHNWVSLGVLIAFMQYAWRFFRPIQDLSDKYNILQQAMAASERVFRLLDTKAEIVSPAVTVSGDGSGSIEFRNVWFTYQKPSDDQLARVSAASDANLESIASEIEWVLRGVSFTIHSGQTAAIVGHTGAGKTTLTSLMMRFYDVQRGSVLVDGVDVRQQDLTLLHRRFGVVLQDPFLFTGTVAENIRLGSNWITDENVELAAEEVNAGDFIRALPNGFAEPVRERGSTFSTGQKQLISFARALAHRPGILLLDEATSSVDTETEMRVRLALERMVAGRTSVVIAHRLSTIQRADVILVMHKGRLREMGTHQQLLAEHGLYWKLYRLQYRDQELTGTLPGLTEKLA
jgi:ATP-binding cassette subfamily B protein